ncbi:MAG: tyrosine-protein phosphatase [Tissierellia bacterium]|nr:tyrosine-protein phosphatase [Tissierellia bacterium]
MNYIRLPLEKVDNCRDLGGYPTINNKVTKWRKFIRSGNLNIINDKDINFLKKYGVKTIIDLRKENEIMHLDSINLIKKHFKYYNVSLAKYDFKDREMEKIISGKKTVGESYYDLIDNYKAVNEIFNIIYEAKGAVLFHCHEGKDRTGIISMLLLALCDVCKKDIIANYEVSSANLGYIKRYNKDERLSVFRITSPFYIKTAMDYIDRKYYSVKVYLNKYCKIEEEKLNSIVEEFLETINV